MKKGHKFSHFINGSFCFDGPIYYSIFSISPLIFRHSIDFMFIKFISHTKRNAIEIFLMLSSYYSLIIQLPV